MSGAAGIPKAHFARLIFAWGKKTIKHVVNVDGAAFFGGVQLSSLLKKYPRTKAYPIQQLNINQLAAILFTSGSTGTPRPSAGFVTAIAAAATACTPPRDAAGTPAALPSISTIPSLGARASACACVSPSRIHASDRTRIGAYLRMGGAPKRRRLNA